MNKSLLAVLVFFVGIGISVSFQNCGGSSLEANDSGNDGLNVEVVTEEEQSGQSCEPLEGFGFRLNCGDNVFYTNGGGLSLDLSTSRLSQKIYYTMLESHIYERRGVTFTRDLPTSYCANSALPHCAHTNNDPCVGLGCFKPSVPVRCHWQQRLSRAEERNALSALNSLQFVTRNVSADDPMMSDCNNPLLNFYSQDKTVSMSLATRACVPNGMYYAVDDSEDNIRGIFDNELGEVASLTNNQGDPEYCNNYSAFAWDTTKARYVSVSGFTRLEDSYRFEVNYEARTMNIDGEDVLAGVADLQFKEAGNNTIMCAEAVPVQPQELAVIFPNEGLAYEIMRTNSVIADAPTSEITFEDPVDGGAVWRLFMTRASALTNSGGAIMDGDQASAIRDIMENVLVNRAKARGLANPCPPAI